MDGASVRVATRGPRTLHALAPNICYYGIFLYISHCFNRDDDDLVFTKLWIRAKQAIFHLFRLGYRKGTGTRTYANNSGASYRLNILLGNIY